jgi:hypothetical protein
MATAVVCFSISAVTGFASPAGSNQYVVGMREVASFDGVDWQCALLRVGGGRVVSCGRTSTVRGLGVRVTGRRVQVWNVKPNSAALLFQRDRNP